MTGSQPRSSAQSSDNPLVNRDPQPLQTHCDLEVTVPSVETLRSRGTMKWTAYPPDVLPLWVAESDFDTCPEVFRAITNGVSREYFGYHAHDHLVEKALSTFCSQRFDWVVQPEWVRVLPDVVKGVAVAIDELTPEGSAIVLPVPSYHPFFDVPRATKRPCIEVPMVRADLPGHGEQWTFDLEGLEAAFTSTDHEAGVGSLILCSPYNPLGRVFSAEELGSVVELAARHGVRVISDEIHSPVVLGEQPHIPTASISETAARQTVTVTATSKGWNTAGLQCAQMILSNPEDREIMSRVHPLRTGIGSTLGRVAAAAAYTQGVPWLDNQIEVLRENVEYLVQRIPEVFPGAEFTPPQATYLLWVDLSGVAGLADRPAHKILEQARVAFAEGTNYGAQGAGCVRINFATSREILEEAFARIEKADFGGYA
ncbi:MalY/PatB family protein [Corynebacterium heidelbergense]|uniref:cysteine-S-conjugate beta-lyase n=1 Tax=Corynebacterium heidelbergense TaxID=2055947 RepID=A0A364V8V2_9CORY|nr:cystathionine beta-lyase [Corynebacterium heidelbergense]